MFHENVIEYAIHYFSQELWEIGKITSLKLRTRNVMKTEKNMADTSLSFCREL